MSSPISPLDAARAIASVADDGNRELNELLIKNFILPKLEAISSKESAGKYFAAVGAAQFHAYAQRMTDAKVKKVLIALGCPQNALKPLSDIELRSLLDGFASGAVDTYPPAQAAPAKGENTRAKTSTRPRASTPKPPAPVTAAALPDVRELYRHGGIEAIHKATKGLTVAQLRTLIADQKIAAPPKAAKKPDLLKHLQTAVRDELGVRGDWVGAVARRKEDPDS